MEHYIIVKFTEGTDVKALVEPVRAIFEKTLEIPGIQALHIRTSNSDIENRYDLMIRIDMDKRPFRPTRPRNRICDGKKSMAAGSRRKRSLTVIRD